MVRACCIIVDCFPAPLNRFQADQMNSKSFVHLLGIAARASGLIFSSRVGSRFLDVSTNNSPFFAQVHRKYACCLPGHAISDDEDGPVGNGHTEKCPESTSQGSMDLFLSRISRTRRRY